MSRDYEDMEKIFRVNPMPASFRIEKVTYPGMTFVSPDGPPPIQYSAEISTTDYPKLTANIADEKTVFDDKYGRMEAVEHYNPALAESLRMYETSENTLEKLPDMFDVKTTTTKGYVRNFYIVADKRSSKTVHIYLATIFPYDDRR